MPKLEIDGVGVIEVGDDFENMTNRQKQDFVNKIAMDRFWNTALWLISNRSANMVKKRSITLEWARCEEWDDPITLEILRNHHLQMFKNFIFHLS